MSHQSREEAFVFPCQGAPLVGILHRPECAARRGVVIVVGGPQYRAGAHRQYVALARAWAAQGVPVLRFDLRGMGDSGGTYGGFETAGPDISAAVEALVSRTGVSEVVLWGLCDAASAIAFHACAPHPAVCGMVLVNPWARSDQGLERAQIGHHYRRRLASPAFWGRVVRGEVGITRVTEALAKIGRRLRPGSPASGSLPERLAAALESGRLPGLLILSGDDLTAREFDHAVLGRKSVRKAVQARLAVRRLPAADHTFARAEWRDRVAAWTLEALGRRDAA